jgi:hypothetical protein
VSSFWIRLVMLIFALLCIAIFTLFNILYINFLDI